MGILGFLVHLPTSSVIRGRPSWASNEDGVSIDTSISDKPLHRRHGSRGSQSNQSGSDSNETCTSGGRQKKKDGFSSKIQILEFGGEKGHPHDVTDAFRQWAHCITYYCDYHEDSYLMPLVVLSLTCSIGHVVFPLEMPKIYPSSCRC